MSLAGVKGRVGMVDGEKGVGGRRGVFEADRDSLFTFDGEEDVQKCG